MSTADIPINMIFARCVNSAHFYPVNIRHYFSQMNPFFIKQLLRFLEGFLIKVDIIFFTYLLLLSFVLFTLSMGTT